MHTKPRSFTSALILIIGAAMATSAGAQSIDYNDAKWVAMSDREFAETYAEMAFSSDLRDREIVAWLLFARANQLIKDSQGVSGTGKVPEWMAWATDSNTFQKNPGFVFDKTNRADIHRVTDKKVLAGMVSKADPDGANEEVTRNAISYDYLTKEARLNTYDGVLSYIKAGNSVDMPVGTIEIKASWLEVPEGGSAPEGALTFEFESGTYWWRGIHIMAKMKPRPKGVDLFYSEEPSWFWTTFNFNNNDGASHVKETLITQRAPLTKAEISSILKMGGILDFGFEAYGPMGTQIRYTANADGKTPVILGHTDMEDFAGAPNTAQPQYWTSFQSSCHTCHATAAINPATGEYFPFSVPKGQLTPSYNAPAGDVTAYLGLDYVPLDFMWPIVFHATKPKKTETDKKE